MSYTSRHTYASPCMDRQGKQFCDSAIDPSLVSPFVGILQQVFADCVPHADVGTLGFYDCIRKLTHQLSISDWNRENDTSVSTKLIYFKRITLDQLCVKETTHTNMVLM